VGSLANFAAGERLLGRSRFASRGDGPRRIDASEWLNWQMRKIARAQEPKDEELSEEQVGEIYRSTCQLPSNTARQQLSYDQMLYLHPRPKRLS
jgi:hypothetical protein